MGLPPQKKSLEEVIITELLKHCAYPEKIIEEVCGCLKQGRFSKMKIDRISLEEKQLGPAEENRLFSLSLEELVPMLSNGFRILGISYLNLILLNSHTYSLYRCLPITLLAWL